MPRLKKLTDYTYSPTNPASEDAIRLQIDDAIQEVYDASSRNDATVNLTGNQSVAGVKTFASSPIVPDPTTDMQSANKKNVDVVQSNLNAHKTSSDHDGRYYTEAEVNALLLANQQGNHIGTWQGYSPTQTDPGIQAVVDEHTTILNEKTNLTNKKVDINTLTTDTVIPFEIHNQSNQTTGGVSSEVTHHYNDATAKVIDNVGSGTILMLSNSQNTVMRPDKGENYVGTGNVFKYRKFNNTTKLYEDILIIDPNGNIERKNIEEALSFICRKTNNGFPAFNFDSATAQTIPFNIRNGGSFITFNDEVSFTKACLVSASTKTTGLELRAEAGSLFLQAPNGNVQARYNSANYQVQVVISGTTTERPASNISNGRMYFDTTIGKPIWRLSTSATGWVDATGAAV